MLFSPQTYKIADQIDTPFIDPQEIDTFLAEAANPTMEQIQQVIAISQNYTRLSLAQTATLLAAAPGEQRQAVINAARELKRDIYGNRIVLFAPLYIGNRCTNRCSYCSFRVDNSQIVRKTLTTDEIQAEVRALESQGHKRLILVYGEHPIYDADYIASTVRTTYGVHLDNGEIRRVNINAAPMTVEGFAKIKAAGIGTYQIFQETYHPEVYKKYHLGGRKADYNWRITSLDRAMQGGIDDVGLGALLGLHDWQFEIMGLVRHTNHLEACFGVGPHTISFPRITEAPGADSVAHPVSDEDFAYAIAVLRLAVPYTGLILTARESAEIRDIAIEYGVSQIDGGTKLDIGAYAEEKQEQGGSQFTINDNRSLGEVVTQLLGSDYIPSFCTACYRKGRTGEHFHQLSTKGFIKRFCTPNALLTLAEYLEDYATEPARTQGWELIDRELATRSAANMDNSELLERLSLIKSGSRDILF